MMLRTRKNLKDCIKIQRKDLKGSVRKILLRRINDSDKDNSITEF